MPLPAFLEEQRCALLRKKPRPSPPPPPHSNLLPQIHTFQRPLGCRAIYIFCTLLLFPQLAVHLRTQPPHRHSCRSWHSLFAFSPRPRPSPSRGRTVRTVSLQIYTSSPHPVSVLKLLFLLDACLSTALRSARLDAGPPPPLPTGKRRRPLPWPTAPLPISFVSRADALLPARR